MHAGRMIQAPTAGRDQSTLIYPVPSPRAAGSGSARKRLIVFARRGGFCCARRAGLDSACCILLS